MNFCDECETAAHCLKKGCVPVQEAEPKPAEPQPEPVTTKEPV